MQKEFFRKISINCKSPDPSLLLINSPNAIPKNKSASDLIDMKSGLKGHERKVSTMANFSPSDTINEDRERSGSFLNNEKQLNPIIGSPLISDSKLSPLIDGDQVIRTRKIGTIVAHGDENQRVPLVNGNDCLTSETKSRDIEKSNSSIGGGILINNLQQLMNEITETKSG